MNMPSAIKKLRHHGATEVDRRNGRRLIFWTFGFAVLYLATTAWLRSDGVPSTGVALAAAAGCTLVGVGALGAYRKYLREADELTRRIQLEGVAIGFGVGLLFVMTYQLFETSGAPELSISDAAVVMSVGYVAGVLLSSRRYR